jgi:putative endopeptidase
MKKKVIPIALVGLSATLLMSCGGNQQPKENKNATPDAIPAFELSNLDTTVTPCNNFYQYAAGGWIAANPVPSTESRWGSFNVLFEENNEKLRGLLESAMEKENAAKGSIEQLVGDFYYAAMDSNMVEDLGMKPIVPELEAIDQLKSSEDLIALLAAYKRVGGPALFGFYVGQDSKNSDAYISYISQSGLGMPDRDYYLAEDERSKSVREAYIQHVQKMFMLIGEDENTATQSAETVMRIETKLAENSMTRTERRDVEKTYNKLSIAGLDSLTSNIKWADFFAKMQVAGVNEVVVGQPEFLAFADQLISDVSIEDWKTYLRWHITDEAAPYLSSDFVEQNFDFYGRTLSGRKELKPRWKRAMSAVNGYLGEPLGKLFVEQYFPESSKQKVATMVENLRSVYKERVKNLEWMSDATKAKAIEKLDAFKYKIGYPDKWEDYSNVDIQRDAYVQNLKNVSRFAFEDMISKLGKEVDRDEWFMTPQTVNAYYSSSRNEIVFPAGILQPPFYNKDADDPINYGGIGAVIGHEFTHGFDDQGSKFDASGNLNNWWTEEDRKRFDERAQVVVEQFNGYEPIDSMHINGQLTLGENLADLGGLTLAYYAMEKAYEGKEKPAPIDGFTYQQRFFLGWVNVWKNSITEEELRRRIITDPHSPGEYRVIGPLANMQEFANAFGCSDTDPMMRSKDERAVVW